MDTLLQLSLYYSSFDYSRDDPNNCRFGSPISVDSEDGLNGFLRDINEELRNSGITTRNVPPIRSWRALTDYLDSIPMDTETPNEKLLRKFVDESRYDRNPFNVSDFSRFRYNEDAGEGVDPSEPWARFFSVRTCNSYWNPQVPIRPTNVDPFYLGMSSQATEREDTIITPDLRGKVGADSLRVFKLMTAVKFMA